MNFRNSLSRIRQNGYFGGSFSKPSPPDDSYPGDGFVNQGWQNGSADDDAAAIVPTMPRLRGCAYPSPVLASYIPSNATLDGPHFRVGYTMYPGVSWPDVGGSEGEVQLVMTRIRPPIIPKRAASPQSVANAMTFVMMMPQGSPMLMPQTVRR